MAVFEVRSTLNHRSLVKRRRSDLELMLASIAHLKSLRSADIADAILYLARRIPEEKTGD